MRTSQRAESTDGRVRSAANAAAWTNSCDLCSAASFDERVLRLSFVAAAGAAFDLSSRYLFRISVAHSIKIAILGT
jgi:hypothetical protein